MQHVVRYIKIEFKKEVGITIKSKEKSSQLESIRNSYVVIMPVTVSLKIQSNACTNKSIL